ncbi:chromosome partitioning protein ParA [Vibrio sp. MA40-2]|uniref:chromosome partitioning protein ParA n=1 Tax=Vibrio sp. MA40-2 TaxID=3391828 RepID=UPI0039A74164
MNSSDQDDEVVVIEERDKRTLIYIGIAAVLGIAVGGLLGSVVTENKWQPAYQALQEKVDQVTKLHTDVVNNKQQAVEDKFQDVESDIQRRVKTQVDSIALQSEQEQQKLQAMIIELEKVNDEFELQIQSQAEQITDKQKIIAELEQQIAMQTNIFQRSRELFQRELLIKQDLERLQEERDTLEPKVSRYKKQCDIYLEGTSFDANSSACDKQDEANSTLSQLDQMIEINKLDLREIENIASNIGL